MRHLSFLLAACFTCFSFALAAQNLTGTCDLFEEGNSASWPYVLTATSPDDPESSASQTMEINVLAMPDGASYRVAKTVANGNWFFGNATALSLGLNTVSVAAVSFDRSVKFQFSSGDVEFDLLTVNAEALSCASDLEGVPMATAPHLMWGQIDLASGDYRNNPR